MHHLLTELLRDDDWMYNLMIELLRDDYWMFNFIIELPRDDYQKYLIQSYTHCNSATKRWILNA